MCSPRPVFAYPAFTYTAQINCTHDEKIQKYVFTFNGDKFPLTPRQLLRNTDHYDTIQYQTNQNKQEFPFSVPSRPGPRFLKTQEVYRTMKLGIVVFSRFHLCTQTSMKCHKARWRKGCRTWLLHVLSCFNMNCNAKMWRKCGGHFATGGTLQQSLWWTWNTGYPHWNTRCFMFSS